MSSPLDTDTFPEESLSRQIDNLEQPLYFTVTFSRASEEGHWSVESIATNFATHDNLIVAMGMGIVQIGSQPEWERMSDL